MITPQAGIDSATSEAERLRSRLAKRQTPQIRTAEEQSLIKATALAWFNNHRPKVEQALGSGPLAAVDQIYRELIALSARAASRRNCVARIRELRNILVQIGSDYALALTMAPSTTSTATSDAPPSFAPLISDPAMQAVLSGRWTECVTCITAGAPLAATVMMGGLLEGLLLARLNSLTNKASAFMAKGAPKDKATSQTLPLKEWTLKNYIDVGHELGWISQSAKDVSEILRDYRNYIHPHKQLSHGVTLNASDAQLLWEVAKSITRQVLSGQ